MEYNFMKGQASVEFLLTILIGVLFIVTIVIPNVNSAEERVTHLTNLAKLVTSAEKLSKAIQYISLAGDGSKQTLQLVVPSTATFECDDSGPNTVINIDYNTGTTSFYEGGISPTNQCWFDDNGTPTNPNDDDDVISCIKTLDPGVHFSCEPIDSGIYIATVTKVTGDTPPVVVAVTKIGDI